MDLNHRLRLLDQLDAPMVSGQKHPVSAQAHELAEWASEQLGRPILAHQIQAILDRPDQLPAPLSSTARQEEAWPSPAKMRSLIMWGGALTLGSLTVALTHAMGPMSGMVYVLLGPMGSLLMGHGLKGWIQRREAQTLTLSLED
jgi:hypothetical protein